MNIYIEREINENLYFTFRFFLYNLKVTNTIKNIYIEREEKNKFNQPQEDNNLNS